MRPDPDLDLEVTAPDCWLPLDLALGEAELARDLTRRFAATTHPALLEFLSDRLAGLAAEHRGAAEAERAVGVTTLALWVLLDHSEQLAPVATATLRLVTHEGDDPRGFLDQVTEAGTGRIAELRAIETPSGPATATWCRLLGGAGHERRDAEQAVVVWLRPERGWAALLSSYPTDFVRAADVSARLAELAQGVTGL